MTILYKTLKTYIFTIKGQHESQVSVMFFDLKWSVFINIFVMQITLQSLIRSFSEALGQPWI